MKSSAARKSDIKTHSDWLHSLRGEILRFLKKLRHPVVSGYYSFSPTGDIYDPEVLKWGLGNTVFAAKIYYMLDDLQSANINEMAAFIRSFQSEDGYIHDPLIQSKSFFSRLLYAIRHRDFNNCTGRQNKIAETRQAFAALKCLGTRPSSPFMNIPLTKEKIARYIHSLNWAQPWSAGSHFSHLIFFLVHNGEIAGSEETISEAVDFAFTEAGRYRQKDGSWYQAGAPVPDYLKVNGAMKMITAFEAANRDFDDPELLIDICLRVINEGGNACDNFNIICVLHHCSIRTDHRKEEIRDYCISRLSVYRDYWWPGDGGFSFFRGRANDTYYGAKITRGNQEPDIHGTHLYLWGITLIAGILNTQNDLHFKAPIT
jgi:hypothetical protein